MNPALIAAIIKYLPEILSLLSEVFTHLNSTETGKVKTAALLNVGTKVLADASAAVRNGANGG